MLEINGRAEGAAFSVVGSKCQCYTCSVAGNFMTATNSFFAMIISECYNLKEQSEIFFTIHNHIILI